MKKFCLIFTIIYLIVATLIMLTLGTVCLHFIFTEWLGWGNTILGLISAVGFYGMAYKALTVIWKEVKKNG